MEGIQTFKGSWPWLTLDPAIRHTVVHHSSTSTYIPNFIEMEETFCGRTDGRTDGHFSPSNIIRSTFGSRPKKEMNVNTLIRFILVQVGTGIHSPAGFVRGLNPQSCLSRAFIHEPRRDPHQHSPSIFCSAFLVIFCHLASTCTLFGQSVSFVQNICPKHFNCFVWSYNSSTRCVPPWPFSALTLLAGGIVKAPGLQKKSSISNFHRFFFETAGRPSLPDVIPRKIGQFNKDRK